MSLQETDNAAKAVQKTPNRVALSEIENSIIVKQFVTGLEAIKANPEDIVEEAVRPLEILTVCILVVRNGFTVIGKAAPADADNFDPDLGKKFAYEDAVRQLWPLYGFALREKLSNDEASA